MTEKTDKTTSGLLEKSSDSVESAEGGRGNLSHETSGSVWYLVLVSLVGVVGGFLFGFDTAVISGTVDMVKALYHLSGASVGWFTSSALIGCILGALVAGKFADQFGRRPVLMVSAVLFLASALGCMVTTSFTVLICARWVGGLGVGLASVVEPLYISEFSPARMRGRLVALYQLAIVVGILAAYFSNYLLLSFSLSGSSIFGSSGFWHHVFIAQVWRAMFGAAMLPAVFFMVLRIFMPETPRWLVKAGRDKEGLDILRKIDGDAVAARELTEIQATLTEKKESIAVLFQPGLRRALIIGCGLSFLGQLTGVNIVIYYGPTILRAAGLALGGTLQYQVILGVINLVFTVIAMQIIDRFGRRPLLIGGMVPVCLTLAAAGVMFSSKNPNPMVLLVLLGIYIACVALSICAVIWVLTSEIFPNRVRARGMALATLTNWSMNAFAAGFFPWYVGRFGMNVGFFTFAFTSLCTTIFVWKCIPETKGKSLEEIEAFWESRSRHVL
ncbi:MAG: sugar porter family MFS transporter [Armatimonadota bacterium]